MNFKKLPEKDKKLEVWIFGVILLAAIIVLLLVIFTDNGIWVGNVDSSQSYLLSSIIQGLAAVIALLITFSLVATQPIAGAYATMVVKFHIRNKWLWLAIFIYLVAIIWSAMSLGHLREWQWFQENTQDALDIALILAVTALLYIIPFTLATLKNLQPEYIAKKLVNQIDTRLLDYFLRVTINMGTIPLTKYTLDFLFFRVNQLLEVSVKRNEISLQISELLISVGRHACERNSPEAAETVMSTLAQLVEYCNAPPRLWRQAADVFNEAIKELYYYSYSLIEEG